MCVRLCDCVGLSRRYFVWRHGQVTNDMARIEHQQTLLANVTVVEKCVVCMCVLVYVCVCVCVCVCRLSLVF